MESDDFGPLTSAEETPHNDADLLQQLAVLQQRNIALENDFGQKRAKFMELFKQKEDELGDIKQTLVEYSKKVDEQEATIKTMQQENDDIKTAVVISEASKEDEVQEMQRKCGEEVASLHHIMKEAVSQAHQSAANQLDQERTAWQQERLAMEKDVHDARSKLSQEREGFLASLAKQVQKKVGAAGAVIAGQSLSEQETLEDSMKKAQEDAEILRSVVLPLEQEIAWLKERLRKAGLSNGELSAVRTDAALHNADSCLSDEGDDKNGFADISTMSKGSMNSISDELLKFEDDNPSELANSAAQDSSHSPNLHRSDSSQSLQSITKALFGTHETTSLSDEAGTLGMSPDRTVHPPFVTESQRDTSRDTSPQIEQGRSIVPKVQAEASEESKPCDMCQNYESQLQQLQEEQKKAESQVRTLERQLLAERESLSGMKQYTEELETNLKAVADSVGCQVNTLLSKGRDSETFLNGIKSQCTQMQNDLHEHLKMLTGDREEIQNELTKLQDENDALIGKHCKNSQQMQEESINLPSSMEEMQLLLLKYREDLITAKAAREHIEESLRSEIMFVRDRIVAEQQEKANIEEALSQEINHLQEELAVLQCIKLEVATQNQRNQELDVKLQDTEGQFKALQTKSRQVTSQLQGQLDELSKDKKKLLEDVTRLKVKVSSLQTDLDNSEAVQRDFVKLSQSLQIQLEKIRQAEHEVRWQHEEDMDDCSNCHLDFSVTKRKHHCRHCGRIFCTDCLTKTVNSGPHLRPSKVCDVCHTILVRDATPYFSTEPPATPD